VSEESTRLAEIAEQMSTWMLGTLPWLIGGFALAYGLVYVFKFAVAMFTHMPYTATSYVTTAERRAAIVQAIEADIEKVTAQPDPCPMCGYPPLSSDDLATHRRLIHTAGMGIHA
jgi:hypothetical protein